MVVAAVVTTLIVPAPVGAQGRSHGVIIGRVLNIDGLGPIERAAVGLDDTEIEVFTDAEGNYTLPRIRPGVYRLTVRRIGFQPILTNRQIIFPDSTHEIILAMHATAVELEALEVTADVKGASRSANAVSILTAEELPPQGDVLRALQGRFAGVRIAGRRDQTRVIMRNGLASPLFVVNGDIVRPPLQIYIAASDVECVEVRRGRQAALEYRRSGTGTNYSGVILIWTKDRAKRMAGACRGRTSS